MSLSKDALELIIEDAIAASKDLETYYPCAVLPSEMKVEDLERFQEHRNHYRAKYLTSMPLDFAEYVQEHSNKDVICFVSDMDMLASVIFDTGTTDRPGHAKHSAHLELEMSAAYSALSNFCSRRSSQQGTAEFIEDWISSITFLDSAGVEANSPDALKSIRTVEINKEDKQVHGVQQFSVNKSNMEKLDAAGKDFKPLPSFVVFKCSPYRGLKERDILCRVSLLIARDCIEFMLTIVRKEELKEEITKEFVDLIDESLPLMSTMVGRFSI